MTLYNKKKEMGEKDVSVVTTIFMIGSFCNVFSSRLIISFVLHNPHVTKCYLYTVLTQHQIVMIYTTYE